MQLHNHWQQFALPLNQAMLSVVIMRRIIIDMSSQFLTSFQFYSYTQPAKLPVSVDEKEMYVCT